MPIDRSDEEGHVCLVVRYNTETTRPDIKVGDLCGTGSFVCTTKLTSASYMELLIHKIFRFNVLWLLNFFNSQSDLLLYDAVWTIIIQTISTIIN